MQTATIRRLPKSFWSYVRGGGPLTVEPFPPGAKPPPIVALPRNRRLMLQSRRAREWAETSGYAVARGAGAFGGVRAPGEKAFRRLIESAVLCGFEVGVGEVES